MSAAVLPIPKKAHLADEYAGHKYPKNAFHSTIIDIISTRPNERLSYSKTQP
jgi:hypothetical protein